MGAALAAGRAGVDDFVAVDMGGTSFDLCLVRGGRPEIKTDWNWRYRYYIGLPMVDVQSVGAGGGSIARVRQGALLVGPESAGSNPGRSATAAAANGPTVTDADAVLGYLPAEGFAGGRMQLDVDAARAAIDRDVAEPLGLDVTEAAWGIERIVNANMANATRRVLASHGADPRTLALIAYGGNGPVHAWAIAGELGVGRMLVPKAAPAFSALGVLVADYVVDLVRSYVTPLSQVDLERLRRLMADVASEAAKELEPDRPRRDDAPSHFVQMCYPGQNFDMSVPTSPDVADDDLLDLAERFHDQHERERGLQLPQPAAADPRRAARRPGHHARSRSSSPTLGTADRRRSRRASAPVTRTSASSTSPTPVYDGPALAPGWRSVARRWCRSRSPSSSCHRAPGSPSTPPGTTNSTSGNRETGRRVCPHSRLPRSSAFPSWC